MTEGANRSDAAFVKGRGSWEETLSSSVRGKCHGGEAFRHDGRCDSSRSSNRRRSFHSRQQFLSAESSPGVRRRKRPSHARGHITRGLRVALDVHGRTNAMSWRECRREPVELAP